MADLSIVEGPYLHDIFDQPSALESTLKTLTVSPPLDAVTRRLQRGDFQNVILTGMGSSFHALHPLNLQLIRSGIRSLMVETSELIHYHRRMFEASNLIVAVSQSGQSAEMLRLLDVNHDRSAIVGVTNTADSPLALRVNAAVLTAAGKEFSVSCKTYISALMALQWMGNVFCGSDLGAAQADLAGVIPLVRSYLDNWKQHVLDFCDRLRQIRQLFLVGRGPSLAAVGTGALTIKESDHFPAEGMSSAAFRHGPFEMLGDETFVLVFAGDDATRALNLRLFQDILQEQGKAEWIAADANFVPCRLLPGPVSIQPLLEILPVQMITLALALRTGREPGKFDRATKVTTVE